MSGTGETKWRGPSRQSSQRQGNGQRDQRAGGGTQAGNNALARGLSAADNATAAKGLIRKNSVPNHYKPTAKSGKPTGNTKPTENAKPSGNKPTEKDSNANLHLMANGRDFFVEFQKQYNELLKKGPPAGG